MSLDQNFIYSGIMISGKRSRHAEGFESGPDRLEVWKGGPVMLKTRYVLVDQYEENE